VTIRITALSLGAGVQSTTLALLAVEGVLPKPDVAIFADTGWEPRAVYDHLDRLAVVLADAGIELHRVSKGNLRRDIVDPDSRYASIPYFTKGPCTMCDATGSVTELRLTAAFEGETVIDRLRRWLKLPPGTVPATFPRWTGKCPNCGGSGEQNGMGRRQCTSEYKLAPISRKVRELLGARPPDFRTVPRGIPRVPAPLQVPRSSPHRRRRVRAGRPRPAPDHLFDFQRLLVDWAVRQGRAAVLFADCGLGKTPMELAWAQNVHAHTGGRCCC
jgi:hypothetical protein